MKRVAVLFSGSGTNFEYILKNLHNKSLKVVLAITNNPDAGGIEFAKKYEIPLKVIDSKAYSSREVFDAKLVKELKKEDLDLVVLAGFMRILTPVFTNSIKAVNLHPSLLPRHKGLHAIERSYEDEYSEGGVTVHFVTSQLDGGAVIVQKSILKEGLSFKEYFQKIRAVEKEALAEAVLKVLKI